MKLGIKFFLIFAVLVSVAGFFVVEDVSAQGQYYCQMSTAGCVLDPGISPTCQQGYTYDCGQFTTLSSCFNNPHTCEIAGNQFSCNYDFGRSTCNIDSNNSTCDTGKSDNCSNWNNDPAGCENAFGTCVVGIPPGEDCMVTFPDPCYDGTGEHSCIAYDDSGTVGICQPNPCESTAQCHGGYECLSGTCRPGGSKAPLGVNEKTCIWDTLYGRCVPTGTCRAGYEGYTFAECSAYPTEEECTAVPNTSCDLIAEFGGEDCFARCIEDPNNTTADPVRPGANDICNAKCKTNFKRCDTDGDCKFLIGEGWKCIPNDVTGMGICQFEPDKICNAGGLLPCGGTGCPCQLCDVFIVINRVVDLLLFTIAPILVSIMVIVGGFFVMTSRGAGQLRKGKEFIKWAILGYLLMLTAWVIVNSILTVLDLATWVGAGDWWDPNC
ncbi:MAG: pilin [Candidatus Spechtbacterales bacterium]